MSKKKVITKPDGTKVIQFKANKWGKRQMEAMRAYNDMDYPMYKLSVAADNLGYSHGFQHTKAGKPSTKNYIDKRATSIASINNVPKAAIDSQYKRGYRAGMALAHRELKGKHTRKISATTAKPAIKAKDVGVKIKL